MTFQKDIHIFRAIAIMFIVGGHTRLVFDWAGNRDTAIFLADLLANGTVLFVFISGYLFHALSEKFAYPDYLRKKLKNVILPYLLVSAPAVFLAIYYYDVGAQFLALSDRNALFQAMWLYAKGGAHINYPLWFIPMISLYYVLAPVFMLVIRFPVLYWLLIPLTIVSVLIHRAPMPHLDTIQLALYFLSAYVAGMCTSQFRGRINAVIGGRLATLLAAYAIALFLHIALAQKHGVHAAASWFSTEEGLIDWPFVQKMVLCFVLLELGRKFEATLYPKLRYVADTSFGIYFVHAYFLKLIAVLAPESWLQGSLGGFSLAFAFVMACCLGSCYLVQRLFGARSRMVIGC